MHVAVIGARAIGAVLAAAGSDSGHTVTLCTRRPTDSLVLSSMLYDRLAGQPLEHQHLTGEVVRRADAHGIPVPLNAAMLALLEALDRVRTVAAQPRN